MDLEKEILRAHSKAQTDKIVGYISDNPTKFNELIIIFLQGPYRVTQRAAWPLSYCVRSHPTLINPHLGAVLKMLDRKDIHNAVKRNIMRLLQFVDVPKRYQGNVTHKCFQLMDPKEPIAVRVFAMTVVSNIASKQPELKRELKLIIEDQLPYASAAYLSRARKILKELEK